MIEATYLALSLRELGLITTKESLLSLLRSDTLEKIEVENGFDKKQLAYFYEKSFNLDVCLVKTSRLA